MNIKFKVFEATSAVELEQRMNRWAAETKGKIRRTQVATAYVPGRVAIADGVVLRTVVVNYEEESDVTT